MIDLGSPKELELSKVPASFPHRPSSEASIFHTVSTVSSLQLPFVENFQELFGESPIGLVFVGFRVGIRRR